MREYVVVLRLGLKAMPTMTAYVDRQVRPLREDVAPKAAKAAGKKKARPSTGRR